MFKFGSGFFVQGSGYAAWPETRTWLCEGATEKATQSLLADLQRRGLPTKIKNPSYSE